MNIRAVTSNEHFKLVAVYLITLFAFYVAKSAMILGPQSGQHEYLIWTGAFVLAITGYKLQMQNMPDVVKIIYKSLFILFAIYLSFTRTIPETELSGLVSIRIHFGHYIWPILCLLGLWRPVFGVIGMLGAIWERTTLTHWYGVYLSQTEYFPVCELALFIMLGAIIWMHLKNIPFFSTLKASESNDQNLTVIEKIALCAVAVHMSNYFYSGIKKAQLGDHFYSWMLENHTEYLILSAKSAGLLPLSLINGLSELSYQTLACIIIFSNVVLFFVQLAAIVAVWRIRWLIIITAIYDVSHVAIFLLTGIFFYKWIILNFAIIGGLLTLRDKVFPVALRVQLIAIVIFSPTIFWVATLGWWDTRAFNHENIRAVLEDGEEVTVPTNFWGSLSIHAAQSRFTKDKGPGFLPTGSAGITFGQRNMEKANQCDFEFDPIASQKALTDLMESPDHPLKRNIVRHHQYVLNHTDVNGHYNYDFYPHHIWSMPWEFQRFSELDMRKIRAYRFVLQSECLGTENGQFTKKIMVQGEHLIYVR
jgi:hypothetical protein